jgi:hypothetical protein
MTRDRLRAAYGDDYRFDIEPGAGAGVRVVVELPLGGEADGVEATGTDHGAGASPPASTTATAELDAH